jgi:Lung seven transmembrane receptor
MQFLHLLRLLRLRPAPLLLLLLLLLLLPPASAEIVLLGEGRAAIELRGGRRSVGYVTSAVRGIAAQIRLDRLVVRRGTDDDDHNDDTNNGTTRFFFDERSRFTDTKEEISVDDSGRESFYGFSGADDDDGGGGGGSQKDQWTGARGEGKGGVLDVAVFRVPSECAHGPPPGSSFLAQGGDACDWPTVAGVGATRPEVLPTGLGISTTFYCCRWRAVKAGACTTADPPDSMILQDSFAGHHRAVAIPQKGGGAAAGWTGTVRNGTIVLSEPGTYVVAFAYCDDNDDDDFRVLLSGEVVFESEHGYLPAELAPYAVLTIVLAAACSGLFAWFLARMVRYASSRIPVEKWILLTLLLAGTEACLQVAGYAVWNQAGYQSYNLAVAAMVAGALKSGVGRCVLLTAALGWGVTKESLQCLTVAGVVMLGAATVPLELLVDLNLIHAGFDVHPPTFLGAMQVAAETAQDVGGAETAVYLIFAVWTAAALGYTTWTLWKTRQTQKLARYLQLSAVLLASALTAAIVAAVAHSRMAHDVRYVLLLGNAERAIFIVAVAGVAVLWRPCENAREYAYYSTQLPSSPPDDDDDDDGNDNAGEEDEDDGDEDEGGVQAGAALERDLDASRGTAPGRGGETRRRGAAATATAGAADPRGEIELPRVQGLS